MPIGDEIETVVLVLQRRPVIQRADEMTEMKFSGRAHAGNDTRFL
jgi:hypothetical protein